MTTRAAPLLLCLLAVGCATAPAPRARPQGVGEPIPDLVLQPLSGEGEIRLRSLRGKVVLLDLWASWCAPCKDEMPILDDLAARLRPEGIEFVAVSIDEDRAAAEAFLRTRARWNLTLAHDPEGRVPDLLQPPKMPTSYVIDAEGVVRHVNAGFEPGDAAKIEAQLRALAGAR